MADRPPAASEAVVICTRNRPDELARTLRSVTEQDGAAHRRVLVVDGSDPDEKSRSAQAVEAVRASCPVRHHPYSGTPSLARQRNTGIERLPDGVDLVHFIDDDVTLRPGYFSALSTALRTRPELGGVGGLVREPDRPTDHPATRFLKRAFFLDHPRDGRVLPSGWTTSAQLTGAAPSDSSLRPTEWLSGCSSSYRRSLLERHRFDDALEGYSMLEDLDLSYRVGRYHRALTVHQRWFVEKHLGHATSRMAYWWSTLGRALALLTSPAPEGRAALRGLLRGVHTVGTRAHPLLRRDASAEA